MSGQEMKRRHLDMHQTQNRHQKQSQLCNIHYVPCKPPNFDVPSNLRDTPYLLFVDVKPQGPSSISSTDATRWFQLPMIPVISTAYYWCQDKMTSTVSKALDVAFPGQHYKSELFSTIQRLHELGAELDQLRAETERVNMEKKSNQTWRYVSNKSVSTQTEVCGAYTSKNNPVSSVRLPPSQPLSLPEPIGDAVQLKPIGKKKKKVRLTKTINRLVESLRNVPLRKDEDDLKSPPKAKEQLLLNASKGEASIPWVPDVGLENIAEDSALVGTPPLRLRRICSRSLGRKLYIQKYLTLDTCVQAISTTGTSHSPSKTPSRRTRPLPACHPLPKI